MLKKVKGITLVSLVVTIIVLLILASVTINLISNGGIITEAQNAAKMSRLATTREQISMDILSAQMSSSMKGEELNKDQVAEIVNKYGKLDEDGDTIKTDDGDLSLKDILEGNNKIPEDQKKKIAELENTINTLENTIDDLNKQLENEKSEKEELEIEVANLRREAEEKQNQIDDLNMQVAEKSEELEEKSTTIANLEKSVESLNNTIEALETQIANLQKTQAVGNATVADVLTGKTFSNSSGVGLTGTMPSYTSGSTAVSASGKWGFNTTYGPWIYVPNNAYYGTGHFFNIPWNTIKGNLGDAAAGNVLTGKTFTSTNGIKIAGTMQDRGVLNWSGNNTTAPVQAGYYSGGTLDSRPSYTNGYNAGVNNMKIDYVHGDLVSCWAPAWAVYPFKNAKSVTLTYTVRTYHATNGSNTVSNVLQEPQIDNSTKKTSLNRDGKEHTMQFDIKGVEWCSINTGYAGDGYFEVVYNCKPNY